MLYVYIYIYLILKTLLLEASQQLKNGTFILKYLAVEWYNLPVYMIILMNKNLFS